MTARPPGTPSSFEAASRTARQGLLGEFVGFMNENTKWWLTPFLCVFGLMAALLVLGSTGAAPFLYTLF